jgi:aspartate/methionine/tyrosine aminotransferase
MELLEKAKELERKGEHVVHMEVGEPDFATPPNVKEEAIRAIRENRTFYTHSLGIPELREAISEHYVKTDKVNVPPERIIITNGASGAFLLLSAVLLDSGRTLAVSDPGYPCYKNFALVVGSKILPIPITEETFFEVTIDHLRGLKKLPHVLLISTPSNPTGNYAGTDKWGIDSMEFAERALMESRVVLTPGYDFGFYKAGSHVRFSYANSLDMLKLGCERLEAWLKTLNTAANLSV